MAIKYETEDLQKTLDKLDAQLSKAEPETEDTAADLVKSLTEVANKALDVAVERKERRKSKKTKAEESALVKARDEDCDDDDDKGDDDKDSMPRWLKEKTDDGKAAGE